MDEELLSRLMAKVEITDGCWLWRGGMHSSARCGFELVPVGKNRWHVVLDMSYELTTTARSVTRARSRLTGCVGWPGDAGLSWCRWARGDGRYGQ